MSQADISLFKGFRRDAENMHRVKDNGIGARRQTVVEAIDAWTAVLEGAPKKGVPRLSNVVKGERHVWLKLGPENVPLTDDGDMVGVIDIEQDELAFWQWAREQVLAGAYDAGIREVVGRVTQRMIKGRGLRARAAQ